MPSSDVSAMSEHLLRCQVSEEEVEGIPGTVKCAASFTRLQRYTAGPTHPAQCDTGSRRADFLKNTLPLGCKLLPRV